MSGFKSFKKQAQSGNAFADLQEKISKLSEKKDYTDDRQWYPQRDKATGKGEAVIRFLPGRPEDSFTDENGQVTQTGGLPWVKTFSHSYKAPNGKWYIEECPTTIGGKCPMCEANSELWDTGSKANQDLARDRKRKLNYVSNILVVSDPANPENNGKVFLFRYGKTVYDHIQEKLSPEFDSETPLDVFDLWEGANYAFRIGKKDGYTNYEKSSFLAPSAISEDDSVLEEIYNSMYDLSEFIAPSRFKSYGDLKSRLDMVLGNKSSAPTAEEQQNYEDNSSYDSVDESSVEEEVGVSSEDDDFFNEMANG